VDRGLVLARIAARCPKAVAAVADVFVFVTLRAPFEFVVGEVSTVGAPAEFDCPRMKLPPVAA
jgi:hypothetical protein